MRQPTPWFNRTFNFTADIATLPGIIERLAGTPARLEEKIAGIAPAFLTRTVNAGKWTIQEHAGHLLDLEWLWFARIADYTNGAETLTAADITNHRTFEAIFNARPVSEIMTEFRKTRKLAVEAIAGMPENAMYHTAMHPRLHTPMQFVDFAFFVAEHDDHHLAVMTYLAHQLK